MSNDYDKEEFENLRNKIKVFFESKIAVHIYRKDGQWRRGNILEVYDDYFVIQERVLGKMPIFFADISGIDIIRSKR